MKQLNSYLKFFIVFTSLINFLSCFNDEFEEVQELEDESLVFETFVLEKKE